MPRKLKACVAAVGQADDTCRECQETIDDLIAYARRRRSWGIDAASLPI
jgi:hypothetical protein